MNRYMILSYLDRLIMLCFLAPIGIIGHIAVVEPDFIGIVLNTMSFEWLFVFTMFIMTATLLLENRGIFK